MAIIGLILFVIGGIASLVTGIWFLVVAFRQSVLWGLGCMFVPFVPLVFLIVHWQEAKRPFLWSLAALVPIILGALLTGGGAETAY